MSIAVKNEALRRYESDIKKLSQKLAAIENSLQTIRKSLDYDIKSRRNIDVEFKQVCEEVDYNERNLNNMASFLSDAAEAYEDAEKKIKSDLNEISQKKSGGNIITDMFNKLKSIGKKAEAILKVIIGMGIFGSPIGSVIVLGEIKKYYEKKGIALNNEEIKPVEVKNPDIPELSEILSHAPVTFKEDVLLLQKRLNELGYTDKLGRKLDEDGKFGDNTLAAVNKYKDQNGLWNFGEYAGKVGNTTWGHLFKNENILNNSQKSTITNNIQKSKAEINLMSDQIASKGSGIENPLYYAQGDYANIPYTTGVLQSYKNRTIATSGCGPTAMAMVVATLSDVTITPKDIAEFALINNEKGQYLTNKSDTYGHNLFRDISKLYGINFKKEDNLEKIKDALRDGKHMVICSMGPGHFTKGGHFIVVTGIVNENGKDYFIVYDSNKNNSNYYTTNFNGEKVLKQGLSFIDPNNKGIVKADSTFWTTQISAGMWIFSKSDEEKHGDEKIISKSDSSKFKEAIKGVNGNSTIIQGQGYLTLMNFPIGTSGKNSNGVDAKWGNMGKASTKLFQQIMELPQTGELNEETLKRMQECVYSGLTLKQLAKKAYDNGVRPAISLNSTQAERVNTIYYYALIDEDLSGVPASITVAQAIQESNAASSVPIDKYSNRYSYNMFGIKANKKWINEGGNYVVSNTWENIEGKDIRVDAKFRAYNSYSESIEDHDQFFKQNSRYSFLFDIKKDDNYLTNWAKGLKEAGYATDPAYAKALISHINTYGLE